MNFHLPCQIIFNYISLSKKIKDKHWYASSWDKDPTVTSMLVMLDTIHENFKDCPPLFDLLINENGIYKIRTFKLAKELEKIGMITDAAWVDFDQDQDLDLVVTGEWMGIEIFENQKGQLIRSQKT